MQDLTTRRIFLAKGLTILAAGATVPTFLNRTAFAIGRPFDQLLTGQASGIDGKILVVVQLSGGNDGLNTLVPFSDDAYYRARPNLAIPADQTLKLNEQLGLHPQLAGLKELYDNGTMSVVQGVGYPNPNRSHFRSMDIWHTANPESETITSGWLGRYFDAQCCGADPKDAKDDIEPDPHIGVALGDSSFLAMQGERVMPLSFERPQDYRYQGPQEDAFAKLNKQHGAPGAAADTAAGELEFLTRVAMDAQVSSERILRVTTAHQPAVQYPVGPFAEQLRIVAAMIKGELPTRVYYTSLGGFDTHAGQGGRHDQLMRQLAEGVKAFLADLKQQGNDERVLVMTFSEFGRRVAQNASQGTDHGTAAPMFFFGHHKHLKAGLMGQHPSLTDLDSGDLKYNVDFRTCYAGVLQQWLDTDAETCARILGAKFEPAPLVRA